MGLLDGILKQVAGSPDTAKQIAERVGIDESLVEKAIAALGSAHPEPGDTVETAASKSGIDQGTLGMIVQQVGGEGALSDLAGKLKDHPQAGGILSMLDRDGDGNPLDDIASMASGLFGKK